MQTRLFASLAGALLGFALASPISSSFGFAPMLGFVGCSLAGLGIGCAASILFDVFAGQPSVDRADS